MLTALIASNMLPDFMIRIGIRGLLKERISRETKGGPEAMQERMNQLLESLRQDPIAVHTDKANEQHYELPARFFELVLGKHLKYSCCFYDDGVHGLDQAEARMLEITAQRADLQDGQDVLELGCGWGSLTLYNAAKFPNSRFTAVSNSASQRAFINARAAERGLTNIEIITADVNHFQTDKRFDRCYSVEMFEHMRNYQSLLKKVSNFLKDDGKLFVHIFTHHQFAYLYEAQNESDWMAKYFFTGGIMPSDHLLLYFTDDFKINKHWRVNGQHYQKTSEDWLKNMDRHKAEIMPLFKETYGDKDSGKWWAFWRVFFMACAELWGYRGGKEWFVSHYLFDKRAQ